MRLAPESATPDLANGLEVSEKIEHIFTQFDSVSLERLGVDRLTPTIKSLVPIQSASSGMLSPLTSAAEGTRKEP